MKLSAKAEKLLTKGHASPQPATIPRRGFALGRIAGLVMCAFVAAGGTWALLEFVVWNKLPPELVGKWVVTEPKEQDGAIFDFHRNGTMVARVNNRGKLDLVDARVAVEGKTLLITTRHPDNKSEMTKKQTIRTLNATQLVLQDEHQNLFKMEGARRLAEFG